MSGYIGSEQQVRLQQAMDEAGDWSAATPGACDAGRMLGCDDPERLGWEQLSELLRREGALAFRLLPASGKERLRDRLAEDGFRFDTWDVFTAPAETAMAAARGILGNALPSNIHSVALGRDPEGNLVRSLQNFILGAGIVPFSGSQLLGLRSPATTVALADDTGRWVAAAHCYLPHNRHSAYRDWAWGGLVCVDPARRGQRLGVMVNALIVQAAIESLGAAWIYELVSAGNQPSRRMVETCGLRHDPALVCGLATRGDDRYTR